MPTEASLAESREESTRGSLDAHALSVDSHAQSKAAVAVALANNRGGGIPN